MTQIFLTILFYIFVAAFICCVITVIVMSLVPKSLLCAKIYTFIFEHDDWLLYKRAKKQGIQHYINGHHFSKFYKEWNKVKEECGVVNDNFNVLDESVVDKLLAKHEELAEKYHYKEYDNVHKIINDDDIVLSLNMYNGLLDISVGNSAENILHWGPMVRDVIKSQTIKDCVFYALLADPKMVVSF